MLLLLSFPLPFLHVLSHRKNKTQKSASSRCLQDKPLSLGEKDTRPSQIGIFLGWVPRADTMTSSIEFILKNGEKNTVIIMKDFFH